MFYYIIYHKIILLSGSANAMQEQNRKIRRVRYRLSVVFFGVILIFGLVFYRYMKTVTLEDVLSENRTITIFSSNTTQKGDNKNNTDDTADDAEAAGDVPVGEVVNPVPESEAADESYLDGCVFVGDSITYGLVSYGVVPSSNVLSSVALSVSKIDTMQIDTAYGNVTVLEALTSMSPENIYIMLGSNGAAYMSPSEIYLSYSQFLNKLRIACPNSKIYIISTPPVTAGKENSAESPVKNSDIDELNGKLLEYADQNKVNYLDMSSALKDSSGKLPSDSADNDGMHLKYSTYETFIDYILTHIAG